MDGCRNCNAGYYKSGSSCVLCPTGQWSGTAGVTACQACTNGPANAYYLQRVPDTSTTTTNSCPWYVNRVFGGGVVLDY